MRYKQEYDALDNPKGRPDFALEQSGVTVFVQYVTAAMRQQDIGLLPETEYIIIAPLSLKVRGPQESGHPERIMIGKQPFMANVVDKVKMPNLLYTQLSVDMR
ncbi:hypothetical protein [Paenibacillus sp. UMB4589-SE434]|uniref:hypothetical protein n=1 Tax=Paenibacillus sp. UMB4589-SE434 TaxID=3046314 RepID=UPI0025500BE9|nr:hypothetical protein [Paenibacillus sp. UMB4589-SE434]